MELPPYHVPAPRGLILHTWERLKGFALGAGKIIVTMVVVLTVLGSISTSGGSGSDSGRSVLDAASRAVTPALAPLGVHDENWPATVGIVTGVFAKEAVAGTLNSLYGSLADSAEDEQERFSLSREAGAAVASVRTNFAALASKLGDPVGASIGDDSTAAQEQASAGRFAQMRARFDGAAGAFAYLLFVLLYFPCAAATGAIFRETTAGWTVFAASWTTGLAYVASTVAYQAATFARHPGSSAAWLAGALLVLALAVAAMRLIGARRAPPQRIVHERPLASGGAVFAERLP